MRTCTFLLFLFCIVTVSSEAQVLKRIGDRVKTTAEDRAVNKAGEVTNQTIDEIEKSVTEGSETESTSENNNNSSTENPNTAKAEVNTETPAAPVAATSAPVSAPAGGPTVASYKNYDFVPGDKIIFYYDMAGEADSEIPGRMLVNSGTVEIQSYESEKVLFVPKKGVVSMRPQMKNESYLPEQFTMEFDVMADNIDGSPSQIALYFRAAADANRSWDGSSKYFIALDNISGSGGVDFTINKEDASVGGHRQLPDQAVNNAQNNWRRVAIYVNKNIGKVYLDQHRIAVVNQVEPGAGMVTIEVNNDENPVLIKNIRIAAGGSDAYRKVVTDGKFIAYGIQFDVNKATLRPESMGTINEIAKMLKDNSDLKFEIGGHTDSDGSADLNNKLSLERAEAVKQQLVSMGIDGARLTCKGYGSTKPINDNSNSENKARNRRVEFVKK